jgi:hypothetical protein
MFGLKDQAIMGSIHELTYTVFSLKSLLMEVTEILFLSYNIEYLLAGTELCFVINICVYECKSVTYHSSDRFKLKNVIVACFWNYIES